MNMKKTGIAGNIICAASGVFLLWIFLSWLSVITVDAYPQYNFFTILISVYRAYF